MEESSGCTIDLIVLTRKTLNMEKVMKTKRTTLISALALVILLASIVWAGQYQEGKVYRHELRNGLVVFTMERHIAPLIYHQLTYRVGSRNEHLGITGISHIVEHMMFKGTARYDKGKIAKIISENSGVFNAFTMNDMTSYFEYLPANKIEIAFDIESDRMQNCRFDTAEFRSEVNVILQERRMRSESAVSGVMHEYMNSVAYQSHPNRDPIIGWPTDIKHITRDQAYQWYRWYYTPNNAFLVLVGDFDTDQIMKLVNRYYGQIPRGPEPPPVYIEEQPQKAKKSITLYHDDITAPILQMAFHVPNLKHPDGAPLRVAGMILAARSRTARLYKRLVEEAQIATMAAGGMPTAKDEGLFHITVAVKSDSNIYQVERIVWDEIKRMQDTLVTPYELQRVKNRFEFSQVTDYTKNADIGPRLSMYEAYYGLDYIDEFSKRVAAVTREDVQRVMQKYFNEDQATVLYGLPKAGAKPKKGAEAETGEAEDEKLDQCPFREVDEESIFNYTTSFDLPAVSVTTIDTGSVLRAKPIAPMVKAHKLSNGIRLYTIENHLAPAIFIGGIFETGLIPETIGGGKPGIVSVLCDVMNRGTKDMTYDELSERMGYVPYSFTVDGSYKRLYFQGYSLTKDADEMVRTGYKIVTEPGFRQADIDEVLTLHIEKARQWKKTTREIAFYYMFEKIFRGHPYSTFMATESSLTAIKRSDLISLHQKYFNPRLLTIVMVGDMSHGDMRKLADKYFGKWKANAAPPETKPVPPAPELYGKDVRVFTDSDYTEATINIGFAPFNDIPDSIEEAVDILNYILASSALTSRVGIELREKRGMIYGIRSELWEKGDQVGYWKFNTKTAPGNVDSVVAGIFREIKKLLEYGVADSELVRAKLHFLGLLPFYIETPDDVASRTFDMLRDKKPLDFFDKRADRILAVTKDDILSVARKFFTIDRFVIVIDGPVDQSISSRILKMLSD